MRVAPKNMPRLNKKKDSSSLIHNVIYTYTLPTITHNTNRMKTTIANCKKGELRISKCISTKHSKQHNPCQKNYSPVQYLNLSLYGPWYASSNGFNLLTHLSRWSGLEPWSYSLMDSCDVLIEYVKLAHILPSSCILCCSSNSPELPDTIAITVHISADDIYIPILTNCHSKKMERFSPELWNTVFR